MAEVSSQTLHIVARELASELNEARASLEAFGEQQDNLALLRKCNEHLHAVHGALRVAEVYGAALLAEEMGQVAHYLISNFNEKRHLAEGLDALMRAMVQLPTYLERVMSGGRDMALVLLPLLNDLRAVRGHALLSEGTLLLLNLSSDQQANPVAGAAEGALTVAQWARKLRTRFQLGLLGWIKGERVDQNLEILSRTSEKLEHVATTQAVFQLWWVVGAILEALREGGLEGSASIKRLLGQADREMKRLYESGEARYADSPPLELLNNLLYYVARARTTGPRVAAVRASFRLSELLPVDDGVEQARESLSAPSVKLMKTVAAAIKEDLSRVKDALDIFVRQGGTQVDELAPQLELLKKIADTLGVLGLGELRDKVQTETADLQAIVAQKSKAGEGTLLRMAATLIKVEDSLDEQLVGMIVPTAAETGSAPAKPAGPDDIEFRLVTEAVLRECIVNMARIKEAIAHSLDKPREGAAVDQIPQLMRGITAGLLMLGKTRVVEIMEGIDKALQNFVRSDGLTLPQEAVDRLADAIVAVEYYMETIQAGRADPWYMLDNAETCLRYLSEAQPIPRVDAFGDATPDHARTVVIETHAPTVALGTEHEPTAVLDPVTQQVRRPTKPAAVPQPPPAPMPPALTKPVDREVDPEFVELFIEEAKDEIAKLNQFFPLWDSNPQDQEALVNVRRSFHTLKGSGRMVGAQLIGDFAWSVENMLNRVINKTLDRTPDMMSLMRSAVAAVPELVEQLETGRAPQADIAKIINTANTLAGVRPSSPAPAAAPAAAPAPVRRPEPPVLAAAMEAPTLSPAPEKKTDPAPEVTTLAAPLAESPMDPGLHEIYAKETAGHLATIHKFIAACQLATPPYAVTEDLHRSCHTLSGTAKTAGARQGIKIAEPLNRYVRKLYDNSIGMPDAGLASLSDAVTAIQQVVENINENTGFFLDHNLIVRRLNELEHALDAEISRIAELGATTASNATNSELTGEHLITSTAATSINQHLAVPPPSLEPVHVDELSLTAVNAMLPPLEPETFELAPVEPSVLEAGTLGPLAPNETTLAAAGELNVGADAVPEEITLDSIALELPEDAVEEITLDAATLAGDLASGGAAEAAGEEIVLGSVDLTPEEITLGEPAGEVVELESALDTLQWAYEHFPAEGAGPAANIDVSSGEAEIEEVELTAEDDLTQEAAALAELTKEEPGIVVDEQLLEESNRALLQMNEPLPEEASDLIVETAPWAAEYEPPVLPPETAVARDDAETIRSPLLRPAAAETLASETAQSASSADLQSAQAVAESAALSMSEPAPIAAQSQPAVEAAPAIEDEGDYDDSDFDPEVAAIFTEEATELLETADQSLSSWIRDRANTALVFELKRVVHTLKGGARMAGIRAMGDLSHELETLMGLVESGQVPAEQKVFDALQASLDELHRMRDVVANGERCKPARELMRRIRALIGGQAEEEPAPAPAPAPAPTAAAAIMPAAPIAPEIVPPAALTPAPVFDAPAEEIVEIESYSPDDKDIGSHTDIVPTLGDIAALTEDDVAKRALSDAEDARSSDVVADGELSEGAWEDAGTTAARSDAALPAAPEIEDLSDVEVEFGADELGAVAARESVRVEESPDAAIQAEHAATGVHAAHDVSAVAPELPPDSEQQEEVAEQQAPALPGREKPTQQEPREFARVDADLLDNLLNNAGEVSIFRSRMEQQVSSIEFNLAELGRTVTRLKDQLRKIELETESQILHRHQEQFPDRADFDPLEMDRYSTIQQLTRAFAESVSDVSSIEGLLENLTREAQNLLLQQSRVVTEMQNGLMRTRMVPFQRHVQRLSRLVRQVANDTKKSVELVVVGANGELDRQVLERMLPPFEHMLRNSVVHGIETPEERVARGKPAQGTIKVGLHREGSEMVIVLEDDGRGIDVNAVRERAKQRGLLQAGRVLTDEEAMQLILEPGFSTASSITQHAGRGVGMDVVVNEIKKLGGALFTASEIGKGVKFTIRLPFTLAITQALIVRTGDELYALPLPSVEGVARIPKSEVEKHLAEEAPSFNYGGQVYRLQHLGAFVGGGPSVLPELDVSVPLILIRAGEHSTAIVTDELVGSREMVVKSVGPQIATIRGIAGATILGDGRIVIILDMGSLVRSDWRGGKVPLEVQPKQDTRTFALVVDDSITVRRVTQRLLERNGMRVMTAKDGVDALSILQEHIPDVILLDIEMPRMDGYELATQVRADARLTDIPIVMITSRVGEKHRARAIEIGVNDYLGKPYQENQLLDAIEPLVQARRRKVS
ncbi:Hpt domain-containing protein [Steroidobacter cummioxidans]|uniref:hybrid sensor histidine kinase/response regulator n=1 Tax=Steroidobacter cummioxidans TaxID=1803913 RepID=UPI000E31CA49|nr:Hpt domain-containing protein [Steroidobacter cummioxidans]